VSWNEGEVVSETEDIHPSVEVDSSINFCEELSGTKIEHDHGKAKICANCDDLARKVTRLQKKVSGLRKSKQKLHERLLNEVIHSYVLLIIYVRDHKLFWTQSPMCSVLGRYRICICIIYCIIVPIILTYLFFM
jgi:hypothetical protein